MKGFVSNVDLEERKNQFSIFHFYICKCSHVHCVTPSPPHPGVVALAAEALHTCALLSGGGVDCWGWNGYGQLGTGDTMERLIPTGVKGLGSGDKSI